jgi:hypothetical protein
MSGPAQLSPLPRETDSPRKAAPPKKTLPPREEGPLRDVPLREAPLREAVLAELWRIAFANLHDYVEYKTVRRRGADEAVREYTVKDSRKVDGAPVSEVTVARDGSLKFKLYDKMKALELLGKSAGIFAPGEDEPELEEEPTLDEVREILLRAAEELTIDN